MYRICFYNHFHNGDLYANREFIKWANEAWQVPCCYSHNNNPKILADLPVAYVSMPQSLQNEDTKYKKIFRIEETIYVNTWIGCYMAWASLDDVIVTDPVIGLNWVVYHKMWRYIVEQLNGILQTAKVLSANVNHFIGNPISEFYVNHQFLKTKLDLQKTSILISNGPALSGQAYQNHGMESWFKDIIPQYPQVQWIFTHGTTIYANNVFYTQDIFDNRPCDLNEIGELSKHCGIIIGRNSGPFLFCNTLYNLNAKKKTFIATGRVRGDCFPVGLQLSCDYYWLCDQDDIQTKNIIASIVENKLWF